MNSILLAHDGSPSAERALAYTLAHYPKDAFYLHILNVQIPIASGNVRSYISGEQLNNFYRDEAEIILKPLKEQLTRQGMRFTAHIGVGDPAETIVRFAKDLACEAIVMGSRGLGTFAGLMLGSVATKVINLTSLPVTLIK